MNPYLGFVSDYERLLREGRNLPLGIPDSPALANVPPEAPRVLIFSPHPDDECIIGGLPLRLLRESRMRVINVAVTQGSKKERQAGRWEELQNACRFMGYGLIQTKTGGLENVNARTRERDPVQWRESVSIIASIIRAPSPRILFFPHEHDWNSSHIGTHWLVRDALVSLGQDFYAAVVETEFWGQNAHPNLMVESSREDVADLVAGTSFHVGEVQRNPFHLFLPAWMQDNVRRGSELVGGQGQAAPDFRFATLYRLRRWRNGQLENLFEGGRSISREQRVESLFANTLS